jgi:chaperonin cofactor prefoldin
MYNDLNETIRKLEERIERLEKEERAMKTAFSRMLKLLGTNL